MFFSPKTWRTGATYSSPQQREKMIFIMRRLAVETRGRKQGLIPAADATSTKAPPQYKLVVLFNQAHSSRARQKTKDSLPQIKMFLRPRNELTRSSLVTRQQGGSRLWQKRHHSWQLLRSQARRRVRGGDGAAALVVLVEAELHHSPGPDLGHVARVRAQDGPAAFVRCASRCASQPRAERRALVGWLVGQRFSAVGSFCEEMHTDAHARTHVVLNFSPPVKRAGLM